VSATGRFVVGALFAMAGGALVIAASRLSWVVIETRGDPVVLTPGRTAYIGRSVISRSGHELIPTLLPLGVLIVLAAGLTLLSSPRARRWWLAAAIGAGGLVLAQVIAKWTQRARPISAPGEALPGVHAGSARAVGMAGALVAIVAVLAALRSASRARPLRLPE
jgi:hypothetical protein